MSDPLDFAGLLVARICHDFAGAVGALTSGAELLLDEPDPELRAEFARMMGETAAGLGGRLKLIRLAFGGALDGPAVPTAELAATLRDGLGESICKVEAMADAGSSLPRPQARVLAALTMVAATACAEVRARAALVAFGPGGLDAHASQCTIGPAVRAALAGESAPTSSALAPAAYAARAAAACGLLIAVEEQPGLLRFRLLPIAPR
ncbi:MAG: histidine phosphotransferase family protein [Sphingomonadaceae bacterium]|nr:histidine phosphotransferase family protein [Sphingomonadaceae bacterium]